MEKEKLYELLKQLPEKEIKEIQEYIEDGNYKVALQKIKEWNEKNNKPSDEEVSIEKEEQADEGIPKQISNIELEKIYIRIIIN